MKFFSKTKYPILIVLLLLAMYFVSSTIALRPVIQKLLFIIIPAICLVLGVLEIRKIYKSYSSPLKVKNWIVIISLSLFTAGLILFAFAFSSISTKTEGMFTTYKHRYKFDNITFYTYQTGLMGIVTKVRYSEKYEWISHPIDSILFTCYADSVHIEQKDSSFLIFGQEQKFVFLPGSNTKQGSGK